MREYGMHSLIAVPMSKHLYSCVESHATISPPNFLAMAMPTVDLPDAVGPTITMRGESVVAALIETEYAIRAREG